METEKMLHLKTTVIITGGLGMIKKGTNKNIKKLSSSLFTRD